MPKKKIMRTMTIKELSGVDFPAQVGARQTLLKRRIDPPKPGKSFMEKVNDLSDDEKADLVKRGKAIMTTAADGHTHLIMLEDFERNSLVSGTTSWQDDHSHPWIMLDDDTVLIGEVDDHSHEPDRQSKEASGDTTMTPDEKAKLEKAEREAKANLKRAERAEAVAKFNDATKAYFETLDESAQDAFLAKSADDQSTEVSAYTKAQADENPVVYKDGLGNEYRKNDDPRIVAMAKQGDEDRKELAKAREANERNELQKRADTICPNLKGNAAALKAAEAIEDEAERDEAIASLKAASKALDPVFKSIGSSGGVSTSATEGSAEEQLEQMASDLAKKDNIPHAEAYNKVLETPEGDALYAQHKEETRPN